MIFNHTTLGLYEITNAKNSQKPWCYELAAICHVCCTFVSNFIFFKILMQNS